MSTIDSRTEHCPACGDEREFVQPPCADGHTGDGGECPEWACIDCGTAVLSGVLPRVTLARRERQAA